MRRDDNRRYYQPPDSAVDYHALHVCPACGTLHQLSTAEHDGWSWVVTRCRCRVYSTEAGPYTPIQAADERRRMLAGLPAALIEPDGQNVRCIYWDEKRHNWHVQVKRDGRRISRRTRTHAQALRVRDELEAVA